MIQRIQTIWLILAGACAALTFKLPYYIGTNELGVASFPLTPDGHFFITILTAAIVFNALITIFLYKERIVQIRLSIVGIFMEVLLLFLYYRETKIFTAGTYTLWSILHMLVLIFFFLSARAINEDDKLIRDSNRLR
jgi:Domain of unknown function (DUF4293)